MELLLLIIVLSPIIAIISILINCANAKTIKDLMNENNEIRYNLELYKEKFGELDETSKLALREQQKNVVESETSATNKVDEIKEKTEDELFESDEKRVVDSKINKTVTSSVKEYIDKNNISQGNLLFALGVLFISIAGIVFATTTWKTIPNLLKIGIIIIASLVTLFLSQFAKKKFKLNKTSITLYVLFCILISLIPLSMGYFKLFGNYLTIGGSGEFLLFAISLLVFVVSFAVGAISYDLKKIASYMPYIINIEFVLMILNFTRRFDIVLTIVSIYNFILVIVTNFVKINIKDSKLGIFTKNLKEITNNTLLVLALVSVLNTASGFAMTILSLIFAISFAGNAISIKSSKNDSYKYIIATIFIIASCFRFNFLYGYKYVTEYFTVMIVSVTIILSCVRRFKDDKFVFMVYGLLVASLLSVGSELVTIEVTINLLISMAFNLIAIIVVMIRTNNKYLKYIKSIYYIVLVLALTKYLYQMLDITGFQNIVIAIVFFMIGWLVSNIINKTLLKNKFTNEIINIVYFILITLGLILLAKELRLNNIVRKATYIMLTVIALAMVQFGQTLKNHRSKVSLAQQIVLMITNSMIITVVPIANLFVLATMVYDYIFNEKEYSKYVLQISYFIYVNLLGFFLFECYNFLILQALIVLYYVIFNILDYKKIKNIDLKFLDVFVISNLVVILLIRFASYSYKLNQFDYYSQMFFVTVLINASLFYMYYARDNRYKRVIEFTLPISLFVLIDAGYKFIYLVCDVEGFSKGLYRTNMVFTAYYAVLMVVSVLRLFVKRIYKITKYFAPYAIVFCIMNFIYNTKPWFTFRIEYLINILFNRDIYILTGFLLLYLFAIIIKLKTTKGTYESKHIGLLIKWQIALLELMFVHLINKTEHKIVNILFYLIIINFALMMIYRLVIKRFMTIAKTNDSSEIYNYDSLLYKVKSHYSYIVNFIVNVVGVLVIIRILAIDVYKLVPVYNYYNPISKTPYVIILKYIVLSFIINTSMWKRKEYRIANVLIYLMPYVVINCLANIEEIKSYLLLAVFAIYFILAIVLKNLKTRIKINDVTISNFAISNVLFVLSLSKVFKTLLSSIYINHTTVIMLLFAAIFVTQFKNENKKYNKILYTISLVFFTLALLTQDFITFRNFKLEYCILVIILSIFVADKAIWKYDKKVSSKLMIACELVAYSLVLIKIMTTALIVNTIVFGVVLFIALIISYIIKNYYSFTITASFMIVTAIYLTRDLWFSIAWWAYLLIAGILLIVFATKNEQLKKQNKNFIMVLKELNVKLKNIFTK